MSDVLDVIVTPFEVIRIRRETAAAMDRAFPGWRDAREWLVGRSAEEKRAIEGKNRLIEAAYFVAELNWHIGALAKEI